MNILYIIFHGFEPNNGISKKISYQIKALEELATSKKRKVNETVIADYGKGLLSKIYKRIKFSSIVDFAKDNHINFVYIRSNHNANPFTINMVRQMKRLGMNVVMEIPTFPYDSEYTNKHLKRQLIQDKLFRNSFAQHLDAIVTLLVAIRASEIAHVGGNEAERQALRVRTFCIEKTTLAVELFFR